MNKFKKLVLVISLTLLGFCTSSAKALTSFYDRDSEKLVIEGVNLDQNFTLTENDLKEIIEDRANNVLDESKSFNIRLFFSPSVEAKIVEQIKANQNQDGISPTLEILKNNDLRSYVTRVKVARVQRNQKSFGFLNFISPESAVKLAISTEYTFDLHDFSGVDKDETVGFEFEISTARSFSGNINFKVTLNSINTGSGSGGGTGVDNGSGGGSGGGGSGGGGSGGGTTDVENPAIASDIEDAVESIATKLGNSFDALNKQVVCGDAGTDEVDVCDSESLNDFNDSLKDTNNDLKSVIDYNQGLKQIINTARKDELLTKKEANKINDSLDFSNKQIDSAHKEINAITKTIDAKTRQGSTFNDSKAQLKLQQDLDSAKNKLSNAYTDLKNDVLRPLLDKNIISQETFDTYNIDLDEVGTGGSSSGNNGTSITSSEVTNPDGTIIKTNTDGSKTTTLINGTKIEEITNADGSKTKTITNPDGTKIVEKIVTNPDGSVTTTTTNPNGTTTVAKKVTNADGSITTTTTNPDGTTKVERKVTNSDGSITTTTTNPDGSITTSTEKKGLDGTIVTTFNNGRVISKSPDGVTKESVTNADGSVTTKVTGADGKVSTEKAVTNSDGSITTTVTNPDGTTTSKKTVTNSDGSKTTTITNPDGTTTIEVEVKNADGSITTIRTNPNGSKVTIKKVFNANGSVTTTTTNADGSKITSIQNPDGTRLVTNPDGSTLETKKNGSIVLTKTNANGSITKTETKANGTVIETTTVTNTDGSKTEIKKTTNSDGTISNSVKEINANGSSTTTITNPNGTTTKIVETKNLDGSTTIVTTNPDGTITTSKKVTNSDGSVTTTTTNPDGTTSTITEKTNADGSILKTTTVFTPTNNGGGGGVTDAEIAAALLDVIDDYSRNIADSFKSIDQDFTCGATNSAKTIDICSSEGLVTFKTRLVTSNTKLRRVQLNNSRTLKQVINSAKNSKVISKKRAKSLITRINRNNVRIRRSRKVLIRLDHRIQARTNRGKTFNSIKASNFFERKIHRAKLNINRSYVRLQQTVINPLFNLSLISEADNAKYGVSISELK
jgi:phosphoribosylformylglycinamidine (FGAM) synthase-like amidotransferase family enzyme